MDPKQQRFFKTNDLHDLFTLAEGKNKGTTETGAIFSGSVEEMTRKTIKMNERAAKSGESGAEKETTEGKRLELIK